MKADAVACRLEGSVFTDFRMMFRSTGGVRGGSVAKSAARPLSIRVNTAWFSSFVR